MEGGRVVYCYSSSWTRDCAKSQKIQQLQGGVGEGEGFVVSRLFLAKLDEIRFGVESGSVGPFFEIM